MYLAAEVVGAEVWSWCGSFLGSVDRFPRNPDFSASTWWRPEAAFLEGRTVGTVPGFGHWVEQLTRAILSSQSRLLRDIAKYCTSMSSSEVH